MQLVVRRSDLPALFVLGLTFLIGLGSANAQARKRIAIYPFDDSVAGTVRINIGEKVADGLISKLAGNGTFEVVDRQYLNRIMAEQNLKMDGRFDPTGAAKLGKLANIDVLIIGHVDAFHANASSEEANGFLSKKTKVLGEIELKVTSRLISVETASILAAPAASTELKQVLAERTEILPSDRGSFTSRNTGPGNVQTALLKLVDKGVDEISADLAKQIEASVTKIPSAGRGAIGTAAKVVGMQGDLVLINRGTTAGIKVGQQFVVVRPVDTGLKDPDTGQPVIRRKKICSMSITEVEDSISSGKCDGEQTLAGDEAKLAQN